MAVCTSKQNIKEQAMNRRNLLAKTIIMALTVFLVACNAQSTPQPVLISTETLTPIPLTETPTSTPTLEPTSTPTVTLTPLSGKGGLLLNQVVCPQSRECVP